MASSQQFPRFAATVTPSLLTQLKHVGYRRVHTDQPFSIDSKLEWFKSGSLMELVAPSGYGKSTVLPLSLAKTEGGLILLAAVNEFAASAAHRHMQTINRYSVELNLHLDPNVPIPHFGVVVTTASAMIAMIAIGAIKQVAQTSTLIIDDANSPMPVTSALRRVAPSVSFKSVLATDSFTAGGTSLEAHHIGKFADAMYVADSFKDPWSVVEKRSPWSISAMENHSLIFMDSEARAADLMQAYAMNGVPCLRWKRKMSVRNFLADLDYIENTTDKDVVVLAHSCFRYGIMLPFGTIIDTAMKESFSENEGSTTTSTIPINSYEMQKGKHRGGHFSGVYTVHWSPKGVVDSFAVSKMTACDADFEALAVAACGYTTSAATLPHFLQTEKIDDLSRLLNSELPLTSANCRINANKNSLFDDTYRSFSCSVPEVVSPQQESKIDSIFGEINELLDEIDCKPMDQPDYDGAHFGKYAILSEGVTASSQSPLFPNGASSLSKLLSNTDDLDVLLGAWDNYDRNVASNIACNSYNAEMISVKALTALIHQVKADSTLSRSSLQTWSRDVADELAAHVMEARRWYATMIYASHDLFPILYDKLDFSNEEKSIVKSRISEIYRFSKVGTTANSKIDRGKPIYKFVKMSTTSGSSSSMSSSSKSISTNGRSVRFEPRKRISELPGYNFNDLVACWIGGRTKQYRRSLERKILENK